MTALRFLGVSAAALVFVACEKEATFSEPLPDYAGIHWVNAVPDTNQQDMRIVDIVSNAGLFDANFRGSNMFYQPIEAGARSVRIFLSSTDPAISSQVLQNSTLNLTVGTNYTFIHAGFARTGQNPARTTLIVQDAPPAPAADSVTVRFIHAGAGLGNIDYRLIRRGTDTLPDAPVFGNVAFGVATAYRSFKVDSMRVFHPRAGVDSVVFYDTLRVVVTAAGTKTPVLFTTSFPRGAPNTINSGILEPIAGAAIRGSGVTAVITPRSVAGSQAPQTAAFQVPAAVILVERRPALLNPAP